MSLTFSGVGQLAIPSNLTVGWVWVGFLIGGEDEKVVHVNDEPSFGDHVTEGIIHETLECGRGVGEAEQHECGFKEPLVGDEGAFHW